MIYIEKEEEDEILYYLSLVPYASANRCSKALRRPPMTIQKRLKELEADGKVLRVPAPYHDSKRYVWILKEEVSF